MISIVQNFICTKEERLQVLREYLPMIGDVFGECEFYVNYNSTINLDEIYSVCNSFNWLLTLFTSLILSSA